MQDVQNCRKFISEELYTSSPTRFFHTSSTKNQKKLSFLFDLPLHTDNFLRNW